MSDDRNLWRDILGGVEPYDAGVRAIRTAGQAFLPPLITLLAVADLATWQAVLLAAACSAGASVLTVLHALLGGASPHDE